MNKEYDRVRLKLALNFKTESFEVQNPAIIKDKYWIPDVSEVMNSGGSIVQVVRQYLELCMNVKYDPEDDARIANCNYQRKEYAAILNYATLYFKTHHKKEDPFP